MPTATLLTILLSLTTASTLPAQRSLASNASCTYRAADYSFSVSFYVVLSDEKAYSNCDQGFLDSLRGQCLGYVENWGCDTVDGMLKTSGYVPMEEGIEGVCMESPLDGTASCGRSWSLVSLACELRYLLDCMPRHTWSL